MHESSSRRNILDDRTHRSFQDLNRAGNAVVVIKQNNPYGAAVIPKDVMGEMEQRSLRQQALRMHKQALSFLPSSPVSQPQVQVNSFATQPYRSAVAVPFAGFLSEREQEVHHALDAPLYAVPKHAEQPSAAPQLTKFYSNGRPMVAYSTVQASESTPALPSEPTEELHALVLTVQKRREDRREDCYASSCKELFPAITARSQLVGRFVVFEGDRGKDIGVVASVRIADASDRTKLSKVLSLATEFEIARIADLSREEELARAYCQHQVHRLLPDTGFTIEAALFQLDKEKLTFWYRVPHRCYFVPLLKALNQHYRCRIWMERILDNGESEE